MKNKEKKELPVIWKFGEIHCPNCDLELYYKWVYEIEIEKKKLICQCGTILLPSKNK